MPSTRDEGSIPQGILEQASAKSVDPAHLQFLGKQAAALYAENKTKLSEAVVNVIGREDLGPEHTRRVCEFANQAAFQNEWEKGGSVRNIEFEGGVADPSEVLKEMHDGARDDAVRVSSDYDAPPPARERADSSVENEIFGKYAQASVHPSEVPSGMPDLYALRTSINGAQDHIHSKISGLEVTKEAVERDLGDEVCNAVLNGSSLYKIGSAWTNYTDRPEVFEDAMSVSISRMAERGVTKNTQEVEKLASPSAVGTLPNPKHPVISRFVEFVKIATELHKLKGAQDVLSEKTVEVNEAIKEAEGGKGGLLKGLYAAGKGAHKAYWGAGKKMSQEMAKAGIESPTAHLLAKAAPTAGAVVAGKAAYDSPTGQRIRWKIQDAEYQDAE